jgi:glycosyltransferase involved in cell wall biosynthesis
MARMKAHNMLSQEGRPRLLVFVVAYYAESTLTSVLERIPVSIFESYECEVLVIDDASKDRTFEIGREYKLAHPEISMTVLRNELNQGYGGNQKVGYTYAIQENFDLVAMVHGDGQYAPEELPRLLEPLVSGNADAVFGSRMLEVGAALRGGMPLYKFFGNKILTRVQNMLLRSRLSEFHSGYRIYSVSALRQLPFQLNSNEFHFDTEIIIQLLNAGLQIVELPIPTYYGDEICRVNGMKYAADVLHATASNAAHRLGILYQRRFDPHVQTDNSHYKLKLGYPSSHSLALDAVPPGSSVLDIGAGSGGIATELVKKGCKTTIVDKFEPERSDSSVGVILQDLDDDPKFDPKQYEYLLMLDIIEHLRDPETFLEKVRAKLDFEPKNLVLTTPNVAFVAQRLMLLFGQFNYGKAGILDRTHRRLFTFRSIRYLLKDAGFKIKKVKGIPAPFPMVLGSGVLGRSAIQINLALIRVSRTLFSYQIYVEAESTPDVKFVIKSTRSNSGLPKQPVQ